MDSFISPPPLASRRSASSRLSAASPEPFQRAQIILPHTVPVSTSSSSIDSNRIPRDILFTSPPLIRSPRGTNLADSQPTPIKYNHSIHRAAAVAARANHRDALPRALFTPHIPIFVPRPPLFVADVPRRFRVTLRRVEPTPNENSFPFFFSSP